jgi:hypothetical protein
MFTIFILLLVIIKRLSILFIFFTIDYFKISPYIILKIIVDYLVCKLY